MPQVKVYGHASALRAMRRELSDVIRSERYTIVEISMFEGRSVEAKKHFIRLLYERARAQLALDPLDLELTLIEAPRHNWGIRGLPGDELELGYRVNV